MQPNAKVLSTCCRKTCHCRVLVRENSHKGQNGKATVFCVCDAVFLVSFLPCRTPPPDHVHENLPGHFRPHPQNTWVPYYTAARDWLKPKGVSALTDRSGVVYCTWMNKTNKLHKWHFITIIEKLASGQYEKGHTPYTFFLTHNCAAILSHERTIHWCCCPCHPDTLEQLEACRAYFNNKEQYTDAAVLVFLIPRNSWKLVEHTLIIRNNTLIMLSLPPQIPQDSLKFVEHTLIIRNNTLMLLSLSSWSLGTAGSL